MTAVVRWMLMGLICLAVGLLTGCADSQRTARPMPDPQGPAPAADVEIRNLRRDGDFYIGGEPTPQTLEQLKAQGVTTVVDMRLPEQKSWDEAAKARELGMNYVAIPITRDRMTPQQADALVQAMRDNPPGGKVLFHCMSGNRAAAMYGVYLGTVGNCPVSEAMQRARQAGLENPSLTQDVERYVSEQQGTSTQPAATRPG